MLIQKYQTITTQFYHIYPRALYIQGTRKSLSWNIYVYGQFRCSQGTSYSIILHVFYWNTCGHLLFEHIRTARKHSSTVTVRTSARWSRAESWSDWHWSSVRLSSALDGSLLTPPYSIISSFWWLTVIWLRSKWLDEYLFTELDY